MPTAHRQCGGAWQEFYHPIPIGSVAVHCRNPSPPPFPATMELICRRSTGHCPKAVWRCIVGVPLPTAPRQCGGALRELHCPVTACSGAVHCISCTVYCHRAVWQHIARVPRPTARRRWAVELLKCTATLPSGSGSWNSRKLPPQWLGTGWGGLEFLQCTATLPRGIGR